MLLFASVVRPSVQSDHLDEICGNNWGISSQDLSDLFSMLPCYQKNSYKSICQMQTKKD